MKMSLRLLPIIPPRHARSVFTIALTTALASDAAGATLLDSAVGIYSGTGTVVVGPSATSHQVTCSFSATKWGRDALGLRGNCRAYFVLTRTVSADLVLDPAA